MTTPPDTSSTAGDDTAGDKIDARELSRRFTAASQGRGPLAGHLDPADDALSLSREWRRGR